MKALYHFSFRAMGCMVEAQLQTDQDGTALLAALPAQFEALEAQLSRFRSDSDLMKLNARAGQWTFVSEVLYQNIAAAKQAARLTNGLYNPLVLPALIASGYDRSFEKLGEVPSGKVGAIGDWHAIQLRRQTQEVCLPAGSALDLGGIAKGWTAKLVADQLAQYGACLISIGGDIAVRGAPLGETGWNISIADPDRSVPICELTLHDRAVVTSGIDYRRWQTVDGQPRHHIIDPRTGQPAETDVRTVSIVHPHAPTAEAFSKAVLLLGSRLGLEWLNQQWDASGLVVCSDGAILSTSNWLVNMQRNLV
ncbi:MAG: FAD:protein FMN transferase [Chloroflexota bacterium]